MHSFPCMLIYCWLILCGRNSLAVGACHCHPAAFGQSWHGSNSSTWESGSRNAGGCMQNVGPSNLTCHQHEAVVSGVSHLVRDGHCWDKTCSKQHKQEKRKIVTNSICYLWSYLSCPTGLGSMFLKCYSDVFKLYQETHYLFLEVWKTQSDIKLMGEKCG